MWLLCITGPDGGDDGGKWRPSSPHSGFRGVVGHLAGDDDFQKRPFFAESAESKIKYSRFFRQEAFGKSFSSKWIIENVTACFARL